jgi:CubicO group peptidase (beta-lactamase class C family)
LALVLLAIVSCWRKPEQAPLPLPGTAPFLGGDKAAVEAQIRSMSLEEKLGQLVILTRRGEPEAQALQWIAEGRVGGLQLRDLPLERFLALRDSLEGLVGVPLFWAAPSGVMLNNLFSDALPLASWEALRAMPSDTLRAQLERAMLSQAVALGLNFLPVPYLSPWEQRANELPLVVEGYARSVAQLNELNILSLADAFSAASLLVRDTSAVLDSLTAAYRLLIQAGVSGFRIDPALYAASAVRAEEVGRFFRQDMQFDGLLAAELQHPSQAADILAADADLFIVSSNPGYLLDFLKTAYGKGNFREAELNAKLRRVLLAKQWARSIGADTLSAELSSLQQMQALPISLPAAEVTGLDSLADALAGREKLLRYFQDGRWRYWQRLLNEESLVLAANPLGMLPLRKLVGRHFDILHLGTESGAAFDEAFGKYADFQSRDILLAVKGQPDLFSPKEGVVSVVALHNFPLDSILAEQLLSLACESGLILVNLGRPGNLALLDTSLAVIQAFSDDVEVQALAAQLIFGGLPAKGKLPFSLNAFYRRGQGFETPQLRLRYGISEQAGIAPESLVGIDAIVGTAIDAKAFPGCQVLVAKDGAVIYNKTFGHHTYGGEQAVEPNSIYDLASITKIAATSLVAMKLYEEGKFGINDRLRQHLDLDRNARIRNLTIRRLLAHQSGLQPHLPVVPYLLYRDVENADCRRYFCRSSNDTFSIQVAKDFYFDRRYYDKIWHDMEKLSSRTTRFRYSDVNLALMQQVLEKKGGKGLDSLAYQQFYQPLGLRRTLFNPLGHFGLEEIVPTQNDQRWRRQLLHGYVHDETAGLLGGIAGHAGLFGTADEVAVLLQLLLNEGYYGGEQYLKPETIRFFTSASHGNHRGLGFDKPNKEAIAKRNFPEQISLQTFGHTGFTGTCAWADPNKGLVYVFLSNRVYPNADNRKLFNLRVRERIHQVIYDALDTYEPELPVL